MPSGIRKVPPRLPAGAIPFGLANGLVGYDDPGLHFDNTNNRLGLNNNAPAYGLHQLGGGYRMEALATPAAPTFTNSPTAGTAFYYYVIALGPGGNPTLASPASTGIATAQTPNLTWTAVPGAISYNVHRWTANTLPAGANNTLRGNTTGTTFSDNTATAASSYYYQAANMTAFSQIDGALGVGDFASTLTRLMIKGTTTTPDSAYCSLMAYDSAGNLILWANNDGRLQIQRYAATSEGGVMVLQLQATTPTSGARIGHYAFQAKDSGGNFQTMAICDALIDDVNQANVDSELRLGYMDHYNAAGNPGVTGQPNKWVTFNRTGMTLPGTPIYSQSGTITGHPQATFANAINFSTTAIIPGIFVSSYIFPTEQVADCYGNFTDFYLGASSFNVTSLLSANTARVNVDTGAAVINATACFRAMNPQIFGATAPATVTGVYIDYLSAGTSFNYPIFVAAQAGAAPAFSVDNRGNVYGNSFRGSNNKVWYLQQDPGQPPAAEAPNPSRVLKVGISTTALTVNGTTSQAVSDATGQYIEYTSGAVSGTSKAGWEFPSTAPTVPVMQFQWNSITTIVFKTPATITSMRLMIGWFSADPTGAATTNSIHAMAIRYDTGAGDTKFQTLTGNGTTMTVTAPPAALAAVAADTRYVVRIDTSAGTVRITVQAGTGSPIEVANTSTTLPGASQSLALFVGLRTLTTAARSVRINSARAEVE